MPPRFRTPLILAALVLFVGVFAGGMWGLYERIPLMDKALHFAGGLTAAWLALSLLGNDIALMSRAKRMLILVSVAALVSIAWEFAEYGGNLTERSFPLFYHYLHGGDLLDTLGDLACDLAGATVFALAAVKRRA